MSEKIVCPLEEEKEEEGTSIDDGVKGAAGGSWGIFTRSRKREQSAFLK